MSVETTAGHQALVIDDVSKRFGRVLALDKVSLNVSRGEVFALLGPNGAGKSTLIDIICTIKQADSGRVLVAGEDVARYPLRARRKIGVVFQESTLDTRLTVLENLEFHGLVYQMKRSDRRRRIVEMLDLLELSDRSRTAVRTMSTGMKRRLEIARALMHEPEILILDEPTIGLDAQSRARIWDYLNHLGKARNLTILVTTHYIEEVEHCDHVCVIDHGRILADGTPAELKTRHGTTMARAKPASPQVAAKVREQYSGVLDSADGRLLIPVNDMAGADRLLSTFGEDLTQIELDRPSLESVFLSLTGRDLRESTTAATSGRRNAIR